MTALRELPPKSHETIRALDHQRLLLRSELYEHCLDSKGLCYDFPRAKDYLRAYTCSIFDLLKSAYSKKISAWAWEVEIGNEAVSIVLKCWDNTIAIVKAQTWEATLRNSLEQHLGRPLRTDSYLVNSESPQSPLLAMVAERAQEAASTIPSNSQQPNENNSLAVLRENMLAEYKKSTGNPANKKIYEALNSHIHKPEFYQWRSGKLSSTSKTAEQFEAFLKSKKRPIPRTSTT